MPADFFEIGGEVACHLAHPGAVRVGGGSEDVHDPALHFDDDQHVVPAQEDRVDVEEVGGDNALGLGGEELGPGWALSPGCRWESVASQDPSHARLRHTDAELPQFSDDAEVAPAGVLLSEATDQRDGLLGQGPTTWSSVGVRPVLLHQRTVPCQDRLWPDEKRSPPLARYEVGQKSDQGTVGPGEAGTADLSAQHGQLVAQHEDLRLLGRGVHPMDTEQPEDATDESVEEGQGHEGRASQRALWLVKPGWRVIGPFRSHH